MHSDDLVGLVENALDDLKARETRVLDVTTLTKITDYMVISSGTSGRHVRSIADHLIEKAKEAGLIPLGVEGHEVGDWLLVDLDNIVVHIMQPKARDFYKLENLWSLEEETGPTTGPTRAEPGG